MTCAYTISIEQGTGEPDESGRIHCQVRISEYGSRFEWRHMDVDNSISGPWSELVNINQVDRHSFMASPSLREQSARCQIGYLIHHVPAIENLIATLNLNDTLKFDEVHASSKWTVMEWKTEHAAAMDEALTLDTWDALQDQTPEAKPSSMRTRL